MAKKLLRTWTKAPAIVKVYWNSDDREYSVRLWCGGVERKKAEYFTDDKADALGTAQAMLDRNDCGSGLGCGCRRR